MIGGLRGFLSAPSLQRRVGFLAGIAVAVGVALTGMAGYVTTQVSLYGALDRELTQLATVTAESIGSASRQWWNDEQAMRTQRRVVMLRPKTPPSGCRGGVSLSTGGMRVAVAGCRPLILRAHRPATGRSRMVAVPAQAAD